MAFRLLPDPHGRDARRAAVRTHRQGRRHRARRRALSVLPSLFTLGNVLCGFAAIFFASRDPSAEMLLHWTPLTWAAIFIFIGMGADGLDGRVARLTRNTSDLGEQLDSMADMVTFGTAPAFLAIRLVGTDSLIPGRAVFLIAGTYVCFAALRLARFNVEVDKPGESDHTSFKGLPSPGAAGTVASLVLLHQHFLHHSADAAWVQYSAVGMVLVTGLTAFAMVSRLRYPHLANRYLRGRIRLGKITTFLVLLLFILLWPQATLAACFTVYAAWAPMVWVYRLITGQRTARPVAAGGAAAAGAAAPPLAGPSTSNDVVPPDDRPDRSIEKKRRTGT